MQIDKNLEYSVGPLLYMPALKNNIAGKLRKIKAAGLFSAAICLEDTIRDDMVPAAEKNLVKTFKEMYNDLSAGVLRTENLPKIFVRVREPSQISKLSDAMGKSFDLCCGIILPKIDDETVTGYLKEFDKLSSEKYIMPIIENPSLLHPYKRRKKLRSLYEKLADHRDIVLNVRVGGNDFCRALGICADVYHTIYDVAPVAALLSDISAFFSEEFTVSAPVWNYFEGEYWEQGMKKEMVQDKYYGFIGKTIIHPNQIAPALENMKVSKGDHDAALALLCNNDKIQVIKNGGRMYENKVHSIWAEKIITLSGIYGTAEDTVNEYNGKLFAV